MRKRIRTIGLCLMLMLTLFLLPRQVIGQVGQDALKGCSQLAFSTEEDFVTQGPEPADGNPIISDGDLLGLVRDGTGATQCVVCARNADLLLNTFDVSVDLGLDAADVIDVGQYLVAFSTEIDSPNVGQFTAGDLLITNGVIIPNQALTTLFQVGYDIGLDAVHFVGDVTDIIAFLGDLSALNVIDGAALARLFDARDVDIWFSTEGTLGPVDQPTFLDGDLLSARQGIIVAANSLLLHNSVPAGIPDRGVDFGLDAVTTDRPGNRIRIHYSTEILHDNRLSFTDGDLLRIADGVVAKNYDLLKCFEPKARELGLDAVSVNLPAPEACESKITKVAGVDVGDISLSDGMALTSTVGSPAIAAPVPFGGWIDVQGSICDDVDEFRIVYRKAGSSDPWNPIPVPASLNWQVKDDAFFPPGPDCLGSASWSSDGSGWYDGNDYRQYTTPALGGCNPGLALTVWESSAVPAAQGGPDALYEMVLETMVGSTVLSDTTRLVQLDNTAPVGELEKVVGTCDAYTSTDMPLSVTGRISDTHFYRYRLQITGDSYGIHSYPSVAYYDSTTDNVIDTGTVSWNAFVGLHPVSVFDLASSPIECGYTVLLTAWERTLSNSFNFPNNQAYHCPGCRHDTDAWTFEYTP